MIVNSLSEACRCFLQVSELTLQTEDSDSWVHQHVGCYTILTDPQFFFLCHHLPEVQFATPAVAPPIPASVLAPDVAFWSPPPLPPSWRWGCIANLWEQIWWPAGCVLSSWPPSLQGWLWLSDPEAGQAEPELTQARGWCCCWTSGSVAVLLAGSGYGSKVEAVFGADVPSCCSWSASLSLRPRYSWSIRRGTR